MDSEIHHVTDTALMVAAARAIETSREGALINDPFAARLAGERGLALASARGGEWMRIGVSIRTHFIDEVVGDALAADGINTVVNFGAGLDTRPWRMDLPGTLRWIEIDFESILNYKLEILANETPNCAHMPLSADLTRAGDRERVYAAIGREPALMITEGLLMYLPADAVRALAAEAPTDTGIRWWLFDIASAALMRVAHSQGLDQIGKVRPQDHLTGNEIADAAAQTGWRLRRRLTYMSEMARVMAHAIAPMPEISAPTSAPPADDPSGVYLYAR